jgi:hypothetical protein
MEKIFEARQPDGKVFRVFEDGTWEGFSDGTMVSNRWAALLNLERGLRIQAINECSIALNKLAYGLPRRLVLRDSAEHERDGDRPG